MPSSELLQLFQSIFWGETPRPGGDPLGHKTPNFWDIKFQIFGAEGAENFEKFRVIKEKSAIFWSLRKNLVKL